MIHESAYVEDAEVGEETKIWHFAHVRKGAHIGKNCIIEKGVYVDTNVEVGDNCKIQNFACIYHGVELSNDVFIGPHVCFTNDIYPRAFIWDEERLAKTRVQEGASIGANATIVAGITIGKYAMIGAGAVVTKDVPDYGFVYGNPASLRGFVCECGTKLQEDIMRDDTVVLKCPQCGKEIVINENIYNEIEE